MAPQIDTAQQRAEAIASKANECCYRMDGYEEEIEAMVLAALQQARRDALAEAVKCLDDNAHKGPDAAYVALNRLREGQ